MLKYCTRCLYPHTKPGIWFNDQGVCAACVAYDERKLIDWEQREEEFNKLCIKHINTDSQWDCIVPVSGGKDSTWQVIKAKEYGLRILAVTASTDHLSDIGERNLQNIGNLGIDHICITPNRELRRRINKYTLQTIGDISWAEHVLIFTLPLREAKLRGIKLVLFGENPQNQYGGPRQEQAKNLLGQRWLSEFGGLNGLRVSDIEHDFNVELTCYKYPRTEGITQAFMGHYFPWDGENNAQVAIKHGFECYLGGVEGSGSEVENLDNYQTGIHDYFKYLKFGFGRGTDIASSAIRRGTMTREEAIKYVNQWDGQYPIRYLGKHIADILDYIGMSARQFREVVNIFTNKELFDIHLVGAPTKKFEIK